MTMDSSRRAPLTFTITAVLVFATAALSAEEQCLTDAWKSLNRASYVEAIKAADRCIDEFGKAADRLQAGLDKDRVPAPPTGAPPSTAVKNDIFARGLLNDVATAWFVKGRAAEFLYRKGGGDASSYRAMASDAYQAACRYKYGRTWDPKGWFWSPCEAASDRTPLR